MQNKMREVLGEVLSDLFAKHLPREKPCKQREFGRKSEVGRSFGEFSEKNRIRYCPMGHMPTKRKKCVVTINSQHTS